MNRLKWPTFTRLSSLFGISLAAGLGLAGLGLTQHAHNLYDEAEKSPANIQLKKDQNDNFRVAIIGSGIGGSSAAYFIRKGLNANVEIDVYEKESKAGGRMSVIEVDREFYEAGGSVIHESNKYLTDFCEILGLDKLKGDTGARMGILDGKEFVYVSSGYSLVDQVRLLMRYGLGLIRMGRFTSKTLEAFKNVYKIQEDGKSFETVPELLECLGGKEFIDLTKESSKDVLSKRGISTKIIDELATAVSRCNYGQDMGINAFTGFVSLAGAQSGKLWAVKGGNYQICEGVLKKSGVNLMLNSKVDGISRKATKMEGVKYSLNVNGKASDFVYDVVVVAVPLEVRSSFVPCETCSEWPKSEELGRFQQTVATFVKGSLNYTAFGFVKPSAVPEEIFTVENPDVSFSSIGKQRTVENEKTPDGKHAVYKIFSREVLTNDQLNRYFTERENEAKVVWLAYPHYTPPETFTPFRLDDGVFYVNAIERAASAMEMGAIGGRNAALLTLKRLKSDNMKLQSIKGEL